MKRKGFTLIELLVVIVIIGILVAIALPNFIKIKDKAKEAEVKQNLHAIQLAVERYATDTDGNYPYFLYGGSALHNIGTTHAFLDSGDLRGGIRWPEDPQNPFDMMWIETETWDYAGSDTCQPDWPMIRDNPEELESAFGDTLAFEGYIPKYPNNPFQAGNNAYKFSIDCLGTNMTHWACKGGREGNLMLNIGHYGEAPQIMIFGSGNTDPLDTESHILTGLQGNFYYHPRWSDGITHRGHMEYQLDYHEGANVPVGEGGALIPPLNDENMVASLDVAGYDLTALGSPRTKGQDLDISIFVDGIDHAFRTGYLVLGQERNPWVGDVGSGETSCPDPSYDGNAQDFDERPYSDGIPDFFIIHLGSGMDKKVGSPNEN